MKLTEAKLKKVIEEEVEAMVKEGELDEGWLDRLKAQVTGDVEQLKGTTKAAALKAASKGAAYFDKFLDSPAGAELAQKLGKEAEKTAAGAVPRAKAHKIKKLLDLHLKALEKDLAKLFLTNDPTVSHALKNLRGAVAQAAARQAGPRKAAVGGPPQPAPRVPSAKPAAPQGSGTRASDE